MVLNDNDVLQLAALARLQVHEHQIADCAADIASILNLVEQIQEVDTDGIAPLASPLDAHQRLRSDKVTVDHQRDTLMALAPNSQAGLYLVPKVIE